MSRNRFSWARDLAGRFLPLLLLSAAGCTEEPLQKQYGEASELYDSKRCAQCHPKHYDEWSASMHAYAADDPVFLAMNQRGQEETGGELGTLCVGCHAPLAVQLGYDTSGPELSNVPANLRGVTCYFCHNVEAVDGTHNNPLRLSNDVTMRARISKPKENDFHRSSYSALLAGDQVESASMCGSCHDIVLPVPPAPAPVPLERTYSEWLTSVFAPEHAPSPSAVSTCTSCHMQSVATEPIAPTGPARVRHSHHLSGVDGPLTPFPSTNNPAKDAELAEAQAADRRTLLDPTVRVEICLQELEPRTDESNPGKAAAYVTLDNANAGHNFPSGASQDRRAFTEVIAYYEGNVIYQSGVVPDGEVASVEKDPDLWLLRDVTTDEFGEETHMFWNVADHDDRTLPVQVTTDPSNSEYYKRHLRRRFPLAMDNVIPGVPDRVTVRMRIVPIGIEVLDDLIASGHLDAVHKAEMKPLDLVPFREDYFSPRSGLVGLNTVTMEWSAASKAAAQFVVRTDYTMRPEWTCVGMPRKPPRQ